MADWWVPQMNPAARISGPHEEHWEYLGYHGREVFVAERGDRAGGIDAREDGVVVGDSDHPEHTGSARMGRGEFDLEAFDLEETDRALEQVG